MIVAAEQSGTLAETLLRIGQSFEERTQNATKNLAVILEPILLVIVWIGVMAVALAVILPIYSLIGSLETAPSSAQTVEPEPAEETLIELPIEPTETPPVEPPSEPTAEPTPTEPTEAERTPVGTVTTTESDLSVRSEPSADTGETIAVVGLGETFPSFGESNGWVEIQLPDGRTGWIFGQYVQKP
jgi:hypothetical protein